MGSNPRKPDNMDADDYVWLLTRRLPMPGENWGTMPSRACERIPFDFVVDDVISDRRAAVTSAFGVEIVSSEDLQGSGPAISHFPSVADSLSSFFADNFGDCSFGKTGFTEDEYKGSVKSFVDMSLLGLKARYGDNIPLSEVLSSLGSFMSSIGVSGFSEKLKNDFPNGFCTVEEFSRIFTQYSSVSLQAANIDSHSLFAGNKVLNFVKGLSREASDAVADSALCDLFDVIEVPIVKFVELYDIFGNKIPLVRLAAFASVVLVSTGIDDIVVGLLKKYPTGFCSFKEASICLLDLLSGLFCIDTPSGPAEGDALLVLSGIKKTLQMTVMQEDLGPFSEVVDSGISDLTCKKPSTFHFEKFLSDSESLLPDFVYSIESVSISLQNDENVRGLRLYLQAKADLAFDLVRFLEIHHPLPMFLLSDFVKYVCLHDETLAIAFSALYRKDGSPVGAYASARVSAEDLRDLFRRLMGQ